MSKESNRVILLLALVIGTFWAGTVFAGSAGLEFSTIYGTLTDWCTGTFGKMLAVGFFMVGITMGIIRQSLMAIALGIGAALALNYLPGIIDTLVTGVI